MDKHDFVLQREDAALLDQCLTRFVEDTSVMMALLMGRDGHLISHYGNGKGINSESLCALAVGTFASSEALAHLAGEDSFNSIFHQGVHCNVYITLAGEEHLLLALFNYRSSAPLVRLQARVTAEAIIAILSRITSAVPSRIEA